MPPKAAPTTDSLDGASVKFILSTLKNCSEFAPNWAQVAQDNDIKYAKNARPRFNAIVSKFGFKLQDKQIVQIDWGGGEDSDNDTTKSSKPATPKSAAKAKQSTPGKKRKVDHDVDDSEMVKVKGESRDGSDEGGNGSAEAV